MSSVIHEFMCSKCCDSMYGTNHLSPQLVLLSFHSLAFFELFFIFLSVCVLKEMLLFSPLKYCCSVPFVMELLLDVSVKINNSSLGFTLSVTCAD